MLCELHYLIGNKLKPLFLLYSGDDTLTIMQPEVEIMQ